MSECHNVYFQNSEIGILQIEKEGLYYRMQCSCNVPGKDIYRLVAVGNNEITDLGICVLQNAKLVFTKCIPIKEFRLDAVRFVLREHGRFDSEQIIPVRQDQTFLHIAQLHKAKWRCYGDTTGIVFKD